MASEHHSEVSQPPGPEDPGPGSVRIAGRILCLVVLASILLPFATVERGSKGEATTYTGLDLIARPAGGLLTSTLVLAVLLFALSFRRRALSILRRGAGAAVRALLCGMAGLTVIAVTDLTFLFDRVEWRIGFGVSVGAWLALYLVTMVEAGTGLARARRRCGGSPPPWALAVWVLLAASLGLTVWGSEPRSYEEIAIGLAAGLLVGAPITLLAGLAAAGWASRREPPSR